MGTRFCCGILSGIGFLLVSAFAFAQATATIPGIPGELSWSNAAGSSWHYDSAGKVLTISAGPKTDWFVEPVGGTVAKSGPTLLFKPDADYILTSRVAVNFAAKYDSAALILWGDDHHWAKLSYEFSPGGVPAVSTVVTKGTSDTWNSKEFKSDSVYLRVAKSANVYILFSSPDGRAWQKVRTFSLDTDLPVQVGFMAQSPAGAGAVAKFSAITYDPHRISSY
jgi:regulation of enolase protein 1 (concanavalin A-like superfamily)